MEYTIANILAEVSLAGASVLALLAFMAALIVFQAIIIAKQAGTIRQQRRRIRELEGRGNFLTAIVDGITEMGEHARSMVTNVTNRVKAKPVKKPASKSQDKFSDFF